jgi:hypothetical protein
VEIETTAWFPVSEHAPQREGWYEVQLGGDKTAFAKFSAGVWTEQPVVAFTHWRGLVADPVKAGETDTIAAEVSAATGVRAVWDAFFPTGTAKHATEGNGHIPPHNPPKP